MLCGRTGLAILLHGTFCVSFGNFYDIGVPVDLFFEPFENSRWYGGVVNEHERVGHRVGRGGTVLENTIEIGNVGAVVFPDAIEF